MYCQRHPFGGYEMIFTEDDLKSIGLNTRIMDEIKAHVNHSSSCGENGVCDEGN